MMVIEDKFDIILPYKTHIAMGSFDGLHIGHMELIKRTIESAKSKGVKSMVYTFKNHPLSIINENLTPKLLMDNNTKIKFLQEIGIDIINLVPFDEEYMNIEPEEFIKLLIKHYNVQGITVGFNFKFGRKNSGNVELLKKLSNKLGFQLHIVEPIKIGDHVISSTCIRKLISNGEVDIANKLLHNNFSLMGKVVEGKKIGNKIGFPTANIKLNANMLIPKLGVYYTMVEYDNKYFKSITNIGYSPTVDGENFTIETHILNFNQNIYGKDLKISFMKRIRDEVKFNSINQLVKQLDKDKHFAYNQ